MNKADKARSDNDEYLLMALRDGRLAAEDPRMNYLSNPYGQTSMASGHWEYAFNRARHNA